MNNSVPIFLIAVLCSVGNWGVSFNIKVLRDEERGSLCTNFVWCGNKLLNIVFKENCKIDFICNPVMNLFPSCVSLSRVLNVHIFQVVWRRHLGVWLSRLPYWLRRLTLPKPFLLVFYCDGDIPSLSPSTSPPLPLLSLLLFLLLSSPLWWQRLLLLVLLLLCHYLFHVNRCANDASTTEHARCHLGMGGPGENWQKKFSIKGGKAD